MASLVTPRSITHDIEESNVAMRRRRAEEVMAVTEGTEEVMAVTEGTEGAMAATAAAVMEVGATAEEEVMAATEGAEVEVTVKEESDPDPGRGADRARGPPRVAGSRPSLRS